MQTISINGVVIAPGSRRSLDIPIAELYTNTPVCMPVHVVRGKRDGPCMFVSAAIHGDEINGVEIIRRLLKHSGLSRLKGTLIAVPIVNVFGFLNHSRYLPDRRDLNRCFPGSEKGSLAARLAHTFISEIVSNAQFGIDLHTAAGHRNNLPHIRANMDDELTERLAHAFGTPVIVNSNIIDKSLRQVADDMGVTMLLYEAGEALRFDEVCIRAGLNGILSVMRELDMLPAQRTVRVKSHASVAAGSTWIRAPRGGIVRTLVPLGAKVVVGQSLGVVSDPFGESEEPVSCTHNGIVIGKSNLPLCNEGDAIYHIAQFDKVNVAAEQVESFHAGLEESINAENYLMNRK